MAVLNTIGLYCLIGGILHLYFETQIAFHKSSLDYPSNIHVDICQRFLLPNIIVFRLQMITFLYRKDHFQTTKN